MRVMQINNNKAGLVNRSFNLLPELMQFARHRVSCRCRPWIERTSVFLGLGKGTRVARVVE